MQRCRRPPGYKGRRRSKLPPTGRPPRTITSDQQQRGKGASACPKFVQPGHLPITSVLWRRMPENQRALGSRGGETALRSKITKGSDTPLIARCTSQASKAENGNTVTSLKHPKHLVVDELSLGGLGTMPSSRKWTGYLNTHD